MNDSVGLVYSQIFIKFYNNGRKKLAFKNNYLPSGKVTHLIIKNYQVGILTVSFKKEFFE